MKSMIPQFLKELDSRLLLYQPRIWSTQIHYAIYSALVMTPLFFVMGFLSPLFIRIDLLVIYIIVFVGELVVLWFSWHWIMRSLVFSIEGNFGHTKPSWALIEVPLYNICMACLLFPVLVYLLHAQFRVGLAFNQGGGNIQHDRAFIDREIDSLYVRELTMLPCEQSLIEVIERYSFYDNNVDCLDNLYSTLYKIDQIVDFLSINYLIKVLITYFLLTNLGLLIFLGKQGNRYRAELLPVFASVGLYFAMFVIFAIWTDMSITSFTLSIFGGEGVIFSRPTLIILMLVTMFVLGVLFLRQYWFGFFLPILFALSIYLLLELLVPGINEIAQIVLATIAYWPLLPYTKKTLLHNFALPRK
jgi:hypothetical protein